MHSQRKSRPSTNFQAKEQEKSEVPSVVGKIAFIYVKNFVTYNSAKFHPGLNLNIIYGPNGTGKSTLVAAIVLGMGGAPKILSRSSKVEDYIKNGKTSAKIQIGIYVDNQQNVKTFSRTFDDNGRSVWRINNKDVTGKAYLQQIQEYNIQIDNLCQFLPQDRVQDFTKLNPQQLLENTQNSVCSPETIQHFRELLDLRKEQRQQNNYLQENQKTLKEYEQRNAAIQGEIEKLFTRNKLIENYEICQKKVAWMQFEELYIKFKETEEDLKKAKANESQAMSHIAPLLDRAKQIEKISKQYEEKVKKESDTYNGHKEAIEKQHEEQFTYENKIKQAKTELQNAKSMAAERQEELQKITELHKILLQDLKDAMAVAGSESEKSKQIQSIDNDLELYRCKTVELHEKRRNVGERLYKEIKPQILASNQKISTMENTSDRKLEILRTNFNAAFVGVLWLRNNKHLFQGNVYEPMIMELNVKDSKYAKYFENTIAIRDLISFTCEQKDDMNLLFQKLRREQNLSVNIVYSEASTSVKYKPQIPITALRKFGCQAYLLDLIDGPPPILNYLCRMFRIHMIPLGTDQTYQMSSQMPKEISLFFTPNHRFSVMISKYSGEKNTMSQEIEGRQLLNMGCDIQKLQELKNSLTELIRKSDKCKNDRTVLEDQIRQLEEKSKELNNDKQRIVNKFNALDIQKEKIKRNTNKMAELQRSAIDLKAEEEKFKFKSLHSVQKMYLSNMAQINLSESLFQSAHDLQYQKEKFEAFKRNNSEIATRIEELQDAVDKAKRYVSKITEVLERNKTKCKEKQQEASTKTNGQKPNSKNFPFKKQFDELPGSMEELVAHANEIQGRIDCMNVIQENILQEFEERKKEIERLKRITNNTANEYGQSEEKLKQIHDQWFPNILLTVQKINENFSRFMSSMDFSGEVELIRKEERDYDQYGIEIRVRYRDHEKLQALDRFLQSGGERSVAIAIYTLSLQHISNVPFRCVDEINQGMDPRNERKIFNMLVEQTAKPGKSQYFFVTPKLLPGLNYNEFVSIHVIFNGQTMD